MWDGSRAVITRGPVYPLLRCVLTEPRRCLLYAANESGSERAIKGPEKLQKVRSTQTQREREILLHYLAKTPLPDGSQYLEVVKGYCKGGRKREEGERESCVFERFVYFICSMITALWRLWWVECKERQNIPSWIAFTLLTQIKRMASRTYNSLEVVCNIQSSMFFQPYGKEWLIKDQNQKVNQICGSTWIWVKIYHWMFNVLKHTDGRLHVAQKCTSMLSIRDNGNR